jgi:argininosuccinate lyase
VKKLWETRSSLDAAVEAYTVGEDPVLDARLLRYEVYGSIAHAAGLRKIGILAPREFASIRRELSRLLAQGSAFKVLREQEDIHAAVEQALTARLGAVGAKVHAGRSRNDQVQADLRLFLMDRLLELSRLAGEASRAWEDFGRRHQGVVLPGYSHLQRAMPSTLGHWAASHAEALIEAQATLARAFEEADACPLGSAAGYGVTLPLDRGHVAKLLGFSRVQRNTLRVQTARPRLEAAVVCALALVARDLGALAWDLSLYASAEFGFLKLADDFTTGSSIMPQKKNPDVAELTRARAALFPGWVNQILSVGALPSGYHRDYQLTKGPLMAALDAAAQMLDMAARLPTSLKAVPARCAAAVTEDMLATHRALDLVKAGVPFRQAYRQVAEAARSLNGSAQAVASPDLPDYPGAPGRPDWTALSRDRAAQEKVRIGRRGRLDRAWSALLSA